MRKELHRLKNLAGQEDMSATDRERRLAASEVIELLARKVVSASVLTQWPLYHYLMRRHGERADGDASALLIGSNSPLSARAHAVMARDEYGADRAYVVDVKKGGKDHARHGFLSASGLALPFADESMDFVTTNQLGHKLRNPRDGNATPGQNMRQVLSESARVLKPGGQLLMVEVPPGITHDMPEDDQYQEAKKLRGFMEKGLRAP